MQNLKVDVSHVARVPLWGGIRVAARFPPGSELDVPTLTIEELAAGKFTALLQRSAARDAFDAASLLDLAPDPLDRPAFRVAFMCSIATSRADARELRPPEVFLSERTLERDLEPLLRLGPRGESRERGELIIWIEQRNAPVIEPLLSWSTGERRFLDRLLGDGEIDAAALHDDADIQEPIRKQLYRWG